ncbi:MAG TPA: hypothetical protein VGV69_02315 [Solirubrobacterales bacterium]|nr:hypothetical protein [Solirubrobacterales bacterium]
MSETSTKNLGAVSVDLAAGNPSHYARHLLGAAEPRVADLLSPAARWYTGLQCTSKSNYLENKVLDHFDGKASTALVTPIYLALCTVVPTDAQTGITITEASYTGYARKSVPAAALSAAVSGQVSNTEALTFANCTAGSSTIIGWALCDSATKSTGNMLWWGTCTSTAISTTQTPATIAAGGLVLNED